MNNSSLYHRIRFCETGIILMGQGELVIFENIFVISIEQVVTGSLFQNKVVGSLSLEL